MSKIKWELDKRKELEALGMEKDKIDIAIEELRFGKLPIDERCNTLNRKLNSIMTIFNRSLKAISQDIVNLKTNQETISESFDINLTAMESLLKTLGVSESLIKETVAKVTEEFDSKKITAKVDS